MQKGISLLSALVLPLLLASATSAHVELRHPTGDEAFMPGEEVTIEWELTIPHNQKHWDLYYSTDGGDTWEILEEEIPVDTLTYRWTVPDVETEQARIRIVQVNESYNYEDRSGEFTIAASATGLEDPDHQPDALTLSPAHPNPFATETGLDFALAREGHVALEVFNVNGEKVDVLVDERLPAGRHSVRWTPSGQASGVYLFRIRMGDRVESRKVVLVK